MSSATISTTSSPSRSHHLVLRLSVALVMSVTLLAGTGDAIDLMKLLDQKQQRNIKRAGKLAILIQFLLPTCPRPHPNRYLSLSGYSLRSKIVWWQSRNTHLFNLNTFDFIKRLTLELLDEPIESCWYERCWIFELCAFAFGHCINIIALNHDDEKPVVMFII